MCIYNVCVRVFVCLCLSEYVCMCVSFCFSLFSLCVLMNYIDVCVSIYSFHVLFFVVVVMCMNELFQNQIPSLPCSIAAAGDEEEEEEEEEEVKREGAASTVGLPIIIKKKDKVANNIHLIKLTWIIF